MTTPIRIRRGEELQLDGRCLTVARRTAEGKLLLEDPERDELLIVDDGDLAVAFLRGRLRLPKSVLRRPDPVRDDLVSRDLASFSPEQLAEARRRTDYIEAFRARTNRSLSRRQVARFLAAYSHETEDPAPPRTSTFCTWYGIWERTGGDLRALVPAVHRRGNRQPKLDPEVMRFLEQAIDEVALRPEFSTSADVHAMVVERIATINAGRPQADKLPAPSERTVRRHLASLDRYAVTAAREGKASADRKYKPTLSTPPSSRPLEVVEIDHTRIDCLAVDDRLNIPLGRPWLSVALDRYTRMPLGYYIGFEHPGWFSVMRCLSQALLPKLDLLASWPDLDLSWPCFGRPETLLVDNGPEFHSHSLKDACRVFGIDLQFAPAKAPWFKGRVERFFGSLNTGLLHKLPGTTFSNPQKRGTYDSGRYAVLSLSDLERLLCQWLLGDYAQRFHRGLTDRPSAFWTAAVARDPVDLPALAAPDIRAMLGLVDERTPHHYGIEYLGIRYNNDAVQSVRRRHGDRRVRIKIDPGNLGCIWMVSPDTGEPVEIPSVRPDYAAGLPLAQHRVVRQRAGEVANDRGSIEALCLAREALRQDVLRMIGDRRITKRTKLVRLAGTDTLLALTDRAHESSQPTEPSALTSDTPARAERQKPATTETNARPSSVPDRGDVPEFPTERRPTDIDVDDFEDLPVETLHPKAGRRGTS